ncbi:hypothetical protein D3C73_1181470 [compost metagenome]
MGDGGVDHAFVFQQCTTQVAVGDNTDQCALLHDHGQAHAALGHHQQAVVKAGGRSDDGCWRVHDVADAGQQLTTQAATGVVAGEVHRLELNGFDQGHRQGITHGHGRQGGSSRCQVVWAHFSLDGDVQPDIRVLGQGRLSVAGHGDDFVAEGFQAWNQLDQFLGLAAVAN